MTHSNAGSLGDYRRIHLSEKDQYVNIRKKFPVLKKHVIHGIKANGNCCWELFPLPKYRGKKRQVISPDIVHLPDFQAKSAKKKMCDE